MHPNDHRSTLWSYGCSSINSGAIYSGVPIKHEINIKSYKVTFLATLDNGNALFLHTSALINFIWCCLKSLEFQKSKKPNKYRHKQSIKRITIIKNPCNLPLIDVNTCVPVLIFRAKPKSQSLAQLLESRRIFCGFKSLKTYTFTISNS